MGHAMPWNNEPSGQEKEDKANMRADALKARELRDRQEDLLKDQKKKLRKEQLASLRARFSVSGSGRGRGTGNDSGFGGDEGDLYSRITGR